MTALDGSPYSGAPDGLSQTVWTTRMGLRKPVVTGKLLTRALLGIRNQNRADLLCGVSVRFLDEVRVDPEGRRRIRMTQTAAHRPHRYAFRQQACRGEVPKVVKAN